MRKSTAEMAALAALLLGAALASCQSPDPNQPKKEKTPGTPNQSLQSGLPKQITAEVVKPDSTKSMLEEMLEKALRDNPDLRLAAAKVAEAEAEYNRARLLVVQKVGAAYQAIEAQKAAVEGASAELNELKNVAKSGAASSADVRAAEQKLIDAKAKLAALEAEMPYLLGKQPETKIDAQIRARMDDMRLQLLAAGPSDGETILRFYLDVFGRPPTKEELAAGMDGLKSRIDALKGGKSAMGGGLGALGGGGSGFGGGFNGFGGGGGFGALGGRIGAPVDDAMPVPVVGKTAVRIRAALRKPFSLELKKTKLSEVVADVTAAFQKANPGLLIKCNITPDQLDDQPLENVKFEEMPLGAVLVWIEDSVPGSGVVVRDYGLVIDLKENLPPGAPALHEFWKDAKEEDDSTNGASSPPAVRFQARVMSVAADGTIIMRGYHNKHAAVGDTLEVYRIFRGESQKNKYLGSIRVTVIQHDGKMDGTNEIIAKPIGKMVETVQPGDYAGLKINADDVDKKNPPGSGQSVNPASGRP